MKRFRATVSFGIGMKLAACFGAVTSLLVVVGSVGWWNISVLSREFEQLTADNLQAAVLLADADSALWQLRYGALWSQSAGPEDRAQILSDQERWRKSIDESLRAYAAGRRTPEEKQALQQWESTYARYAEAAVKWIELERAGKRADAAAWEKEAVVPFAARSVKILGQLIDLQRQIGEEKQRLAAGKAQSSERLLAGLTLLTVVIAAGCAAALSVKITRPVRKIVDVAESISRGNLPEVVEHVRSADEIGLLVKAFNEMIAYLRQMAGAAEAIARGDLEVHVPSRSEDDVLGRAFQTMAASLRETARSAEMIARGDLGVDVKPRSERDGLGQAFRQMTEYLRSMASIAESVAQGDLDARPRLRSERDALGRAFGQMLENLRNLVGEVRQETDRVSHMAADISASSQQAAGNAEVTSTAIEDMTTTMRELSTNIGQIAENSQVQAAVARDTEASVNQMVESARQVSESIDNLTRLIRRSNEAVRGGQAAIAKSDEAVRAGQGAVARAAEGMARISSEIDLSARAIEELGSRAQAIGQIVGLIEEIADMTNLLALNAAIIAAQAGERGRSFAVVAEEVRSLAERSAASTKEVSELIETVQREATAAVARMRVSRQSVAEGLALSEEVRTSLLQMGTAAEEVRAAFGGIDEAETEISSYTEQIRGATHGQTRAGVQAAAETARLNEMTQRNLTATQEQSTGATQVMVRIEHIHDSTQQNATAAVKTRAFAVDLSTNAESLRTAVARFRLAEGGQNGGRPGRDH